MENKKNTYQNTSTNENNETLPKHLHQHNTAPQHLRLLQYGLKIPNHQHNQLNQQLKPPLHLHVHQHNQQNNYRHLQSSPNLLQNLQQYVHQHQQKTLYQTNQPPSTPPPPPPPPLHPHNQMTQNCPQIWLPHQQPVHYHQQQQQQQQQQQLQQNKSENQKSQQNQLKTVVERKKSHNNSQLRSPSAKRPLEAPVTMQGWLHKQGSDGLMLWKKRWFVLSEYCLFYYKGPEEEKLLGSILLPSYKVSVCGPEDKISRKYAFKCEHANMRTYVLAADSQELMLQWINILNLACLLQTNVENEQNPNSVVTPQPSHNNNKLIENIYQPHYQNRNTIATPVHMHSSSNTTDLSNPSQQELNQYNQPLYANAPPKPRRLNDTGYSSPSPECFERYQIRQQIQKSPINPIYGHSQESTNYRRKDYLYTTNLQNNSQNMERRTPDTYGRSKLNNKTRQTTTTTDYEDIYGDQSMYKRPLSPIAYTHVKKMNPIVNPMYRAYTPVNMIGPKDVNQYSQKTQNLIARPHSADFLEYEMNHRQQPNIHNNFNRQQPRPKSSLDINRNDNDNDFYSEERYAEKMRKSAQYLPTMPRYIQPSNEQIQQQQQQRVMINKYPNNEQAYPLMRSNTQPINFNNSQINDIPVNPQRSRSVLSEGSLSKEYDIHSSQRELISPTFTQNQQDFYNDDRNHEQFTRSASARLAHQNDSLSRDGDRKREESMKRLLEWKQRMLQSPLNRKAQNHLNRSDFCYKNQDDYNQRQYDGRRSVNSMPQYNSYSSDDEENVERSNENVHSQQAGWTLDTFSNNNETLTSTTTPTITTTTTIITTATTTTTTTTSTTITTPAHTNSIIVSNTITDTDKPLTIMHDYIEYQQQEQEQEQIHIACDESTFKKPSLIKFNKETSNLAHVSSLRSEYSNKFEQQPIITEIHSNSALVKSILAEFEKNTEIIDNEQDIIIEANYMTMTPKRNILEPRNSTNSDDATVIFNENDENPYVEMAQNIETLLNTNHNNNNYYYKNDDANDVDDNNNDDNDDDSIHHSNNKINEQQPYEMVCCSSENGKFEPVYMELKNPQNLINDNNNNNNSNNNNNEQVDKQLPDIIHSQKINNNKSDSSDADDEASKDLDSLDTPSHPRFSLSDNFRPASYYLGVNQNLNEYQDSSDSELVSPPPIPTIDDIDNKIDDDNEQQQQQQQEENIKKLSSKLKRINLSKLNKEQDNTSICSMNIDTIQHSSQNSDSDIELRLSSRNSDYERRLKSRPLSEDLRENLDSVDDDDDNNNNSNNDDNNINKYHEYENLYITGYKEQDDLIRGRPDSSASTTVEICGLLQNLDRSTPNIRLSSSLSIQELATNSQPAPYYYSDLSVNTTIDNTTTPPTTMLTLNNQRDTINCGNKKYITHIINPIRNINDNNRFKLAAEARSVSVDFLNLTDKCGHIDRKNIYESDTLKRLKLIDNDTINFYSNKDSGKFDKIKMNDVVRRSHSLEGILENVFNETIQNTDAVATTSTTTTTTTTTTDQQNNEGSYLWEEDSIWYERLRLASQRHTKSMDDLDCINPDNKKIQKKSPRGITRDVTYVNDNIYNMPLNDQKNKDDNKNDIKKENSFIIDREKLRQWDLLSSAPSDDQLSTIMTNQCLKSNNTMVDIGDGSTCEQIESSTNRQQSPASGSISIHTRDTFPKVISAKRIWTPNSQQIHSRSITNLVQPYDNEFVLPQRHYYNTQGPNQHDISAEHMYKTRKDNCQLSDKMNVSAGELLGRTHEELVLLLIQLRRQSANTLQAIENCYNEIDTLQAQLHMMDQVKRFENLQKLEQIKQHLIELEKQYEKGKPLVNLVDNMVKLGSLYRTPNDRNINSYIKNRLEFNQQIQERRLLAEEKRDWNRLNPNHLQLQEKVQQLYQLDRLIQEESCTLQNLQQDKEDIERALGGIRQRLNKGYNDPNEIEQARKQQANLENELSRVHLMLAQNSKKLEETVAGNARLEQELIVLKQKLQMQRQQRSSPQFSNAGDSLPCVMGNSAMLESDLQRVQQKVGDLQKQRQELSLQVRQLTDRSNNLQQQIKPSSSLSSLSITTTQGLSNKKKVNSSWRETDLDTMNIVDHGDIWDTQINNNIIPTTTATTTTPLYINTDIKQTIDTDYYNRNMKSSDSTSDDTIQMPHEKQEIKTVRIVKRESERRQREKCTISSSSSSSSSNGGGGGGVSNNKWEALVEEDISSQNSSILFRPTPVQKTQSTINIITTNDYDNDNKINGILNSQNSLSNPNLQQINDVNSDKSSELSPIFKSEAARQIITEMSSIQDNTNIIKKQQINRRIIPKEKRRHYTAPNNNLIMKSLNQLPTDNNCFDKVILNDRRARDDLDMERALRQRIDTPDVVRSTLSNKELKYNENTIDNILGTPNKINIPERYIPEKLPQLTVEEQEHRLRKVESIKKMLSDAAIISTSSTNITSDDKETDKTLSNIANKSTTKMIEEKKQREHLLQLNQILAKQVMEMSKIVAGTNNSDEQ